MPAIRDLYPKYCAACDNIEGRFKELAELVRRMQKDGIHQGYIYDELFDAIIENGAKSHGVNTVTMTIIPNFYIMISESVMHFRTGRGRMKNLQTAI